TAEDWRASRALRLRALAEAPDAFCSTLEREQAFDDQVWRDRLERAFTFFAVEGETLVGTATGIPDPHEEGGREVVAMWVAPESRRQGVATALIRRLVDWAREEGASGIALWVAESNDRARLVYERCGFVLTGQRDTMRPGLDELRMRLPLPAN
ncbi:MAG TPA: GNAT family N-acetyltransferase, partial [Terrimesophilobacter sp.]|nr:GNAT family N-acetyltransferase [Terrimesophilobacter sp.]